MRELTIIGDVHGKLSQYKSIIDNCDFSICVGDFGFKKEWDWYLEKVVPNSSGFHYINPGNHDYGPYMNDESISLGNFSEFCKFGIFTIRGAKSIDKYLREEGTDWFPNEELTYQESLEAFDRYAEMRPKIVISHDCPQFLRNRWFGITDKSITSSLLNAMWEEHQPEMWIFGHHHKSQSEVCGDTIFTCLAELETKVIEV